MARLSAALRATARPPEIRKLVLSCLEEGVEGYERLLALILSSHLQVASKMVSLATRSAWHRNEPKDMSVMMRWSDEHGVCHYERAMVDAFNAYWDRRCRESRRIALQTGRLIVELHRDEARAYRNLACNLVELKELGMRRASFEVLSRVASGESYGWNWRAERETIEGPPYCAKENAVAAGKWAQWAKNRGLK